MKIVVVGTGYVGLSNAVILAQHHDVVAVDIDASKVATDQRPACRRSRTRSLRTTSRIGRSALEATTDATLGLQDARTSSSSRPRRTTTRDANFFDTCSVEAVIAERWWSTPRRRIVIKSTMPVGFTERMRARHPEGVDHLLAGVPARGARAVRQPAPVTDRGRRPRRRRPAVRRSAARRQRSNTTSRCC